MTETVGTPAGNAAATAGASPAARPKRALRMERVYTTEARHPYDEVTWQRRDVVMTNWRDGTVNFEQRGVEFPDSWSVNAVNIVTSKYFRGAVGTEQRESSLRQLIDRVVRTYTAAGVQHGYFATDTDQEIFSQELTWMLLHQVFSFNSPVWFNVGTASPQQVSACFILSVDDEMESILNWYREEGLIFKGGSGAGLNLSRIRSSKELLSSGGAASGPVSFMRGADASAGTIKSGGATRRAAKMVVLDVDHPDIAEFVQTKASEERKIRVLRDAGFDMDLGGKDITSVQYQNANNSVRVSDEFMRAVEADGEFGLRARTTGEVIETVLAKKLFRHITTAAWECADPGLQYDDTINDWHTCPESGRITASNPCSEYLHLDNSSCNLASINLMKFLREDLTFDAELFAKTVELVITAMDISICFADFPTASIGDTTRAFRQLGIGYANLGALLMATGHAYDSGGGRALAAAITSLMTAAAYKRSAELAEAVGPYDGYARNAEAHQRVMRKHAAANDLVRTYDHNDRAVHKVATKAWRDGIRLGENNGWRNAQASVIAPTGCLVGDTLVTTDRGLARLSDLGDVYGERWQELDAQVSTDDGPRQATRFFVNGEEPTRRILTRGGYRIQGTLTHRIKVVDPKTGRWEWKRLADITGDDIVPMQLGVLVGAPRDTPLPVLDQAYYAGDRHLRVPQTVDAELAELVGYFMGDGSLHSKGIRLCVANSDLDVVERLRILSKSLFGLEPMVSPQCGYQEVVLQSVRLSRWWQAAGFAKDLPGEDHSGKGWAPRVPAAIRETNDIEVYSSFLRGVFEADGTVQEGVPSVSTSSLAFADDLRTMLLCLGLPTTTRETVSVWGGPIYQIRIRNVDHALTYDEIIGFVSNRKAGLLAEVEPVASGKNDRIVLPRHVWDELVPCGHEFRGPVVQSLRKYGAVSRGLARRIRAERPDCRLDDALGYLFESVATNEDGGVQPTYDLSVPSNVTYVAAGFVSHNTIGFMMDCDTTGIEPDFSLVKFKKLVGGGSMQIVNQTVPKALAALGYQQEQGEAIIEYIAERGHVIDAPGLRQEHYEVFDCAMGERAIQPMGHVRMMAATQPFISGAISKTVNMPQTATVADVEEIYLQSWKMGIKALAIYRDNCKVGQPLSTGKTATTEVEKVIVEARPVRKRLPKKRPSETVSFTVGGAEGYMTAGSYPDGGLGEIFVKMSKQGSTLAGVMDAFSIAISIALQYGVPLETYVSKFVNMRFEPAGMTDDPDVRMASSVVDYLFRRVALDYLPKDKRDQLGILSAEERTAQLAVDYGIDAGGEADVESLRSSADSSNFAAAPQGRPAPVYVGSSTELLELQLGKAADAPLCLTCGTKMRPAGSCYVCEGCGSTSGCS
ncbi:MAG: vitamin B12-dependent ribonucleotide reductase [Pseudonocardiaceae bacterium]